MASSEGVQKKKRAWRKPREETGPGVLLDKSSASEAKPQKLARISHREPEQNNTPSLKGDEGMDTSETQAPGTGGEKESSGNGMRNWDKTQGRLEQKHEKVGGVALLASLSSGASSAATPVEIDGSLLEGVSH